jgi:hypothetical protein
MKMNRYQNITKPLMWLMALLFTAFVAGCGSGGGNSILGGSGVNSVSAKGITSYSLDGVAGTINETTKTISVIMPFGTNVTALVATFTSTGAGPVTIGGVSQVSGTTPNDFTTSKAYLVTAIDGSTATYNVAVTVATSVAKAITSYSLNGIAGVISEGTIPKTITVVMPYGTDLTQSKTATYLTTGVSVKIGTATQTSGTTTNVFTQGTPKVYTVTANDLTTADYNVNVSVATSSAKAITSYSLNGIAGVISEGTIPKTITVVMPYGTDLTQAMTATYLTTGVGVKIGTATQTSGTTTNVFTQGTPKVYTVTADDLSTVGYNVNVSVATSTAKAITSYSFNGIAGVISEATTPKTISVVMPYGTDLTQAMTSTWLTTGTSVTIGGVVQNSGLPPTNVFTDGTPKVYTVHAADGSTADYDVNVSVATSTAAAISSFSLNGIAGVISEATVPKTITVVMPYGTDLTQAMTATWLTTGTSVTIGATQQFSALPPTNVFTQGTPKVYTAHAADGLTTADYNVNVSVATSTAAAITSFSLNGAAGVISEATTPKTITVVMPAGTDLTQAMTATWLTTGTSVRIGATQQFSALPPTNVFTEGTPKVYTVHAADGITTADYNVNVSVTPTDPGPAGAAPVLGTTSTFGIIASNAITGSASTRIFGDVALTLPSSTSTSVVGLFDSGVLPALRSTRVTDSTGANPGIIYTTDNGGLSVAQMAQLQSDLQSAYDDNKWGAPTRVPPLVALTVPPVQPSAGGTFPTGVVDLGGMVLGPGIYAANTLADTFALSTPLVLDAEGNADAVFVFQASDLTTTTGDVVLINGAQAKNVFWVMTATATIGTNTFFQGNIVTGNALTVNTGASVQGRMFAAATGAGALVVSGAVITVPK